MKIRLFALSLVLLLCLAPVTGCSVVDSLLPPHPAAAFAGDYTGDPFTMTVKTAGEDLVTVQVDWQAIAEETVRWEFSGILAEDGVTLTFSDCTLKLVTFDADGQETHTPGTAVGSGRLVFGEGVATLTVDSEEMLQQAPFSKKDAAGEGA